MAVYVGFIRGINVGGRNLLKMEALRALCASMGLQNAQTLLQSGNVVFRTKRSDAAKLTRDLEKGIRDAAGLDVRVMLRTPDELRKAIAANPFAEHAERDPSHLLITFLASEPTADARKALLDACSVSPDAVHLAARELYAYYDQGMIDSKLAKVPIEKKLGVAGTARNWNTVTKLLQMAEACK